MQRNTMQRFTDERGIGCTVVLLRHLRTQASMSSAACIVRLSL